MSTPQERDPYAPPPMHHDRSGALVRVVIVAALLGVAVWGYTSFASQDTQTALVPEVVQEQVMADAGYASPTATVPEATSESLPPASSAAPAPQPRRPATPSVSTPEPLTAPPPAEQAPNNVAPISPVDAPPAA